MDIAFTATFVTANLTTQSSAYETTLLATDFSTKTIPVSPANKAANVPTDFKTVN